MAHKRRYLASETQNFNGV